MASRELTAALQSYTASLAIVEQLVLLQPANTEWLRDRSITHERMGDVLSAQGGHTMALASYRECAGIRERLNDIAPGNSDWQHDLSTAHEKTGDMLLALDDLRGALDSYRLALDIRRSPGGSRSVKSRLAAQSLHRP